jgi:hypothetical protein
MNALAELLGNFNRSILFDETDKEVTKLLSSFLSGRTNRRSSKRVSVSDLLYPCYRRMMFKLKDSLTDPMGPPKSQKMFNAGTACHEWWQNRYFGPMGILHGDWECSCCKRIVRGTMPTEPCMTEHSLVPEEGLKTWEPEVKTCNDLKAEWKFKEVRLEMEINGIPLVGYSDGVLLLSEDTLLELKSMKTNLWEETKKARPRDVHQAEIYSWIWGIKRILVGYIDRGSWDFKPFIRKATDGGITLVTQNTAILASIMEATGGNPMLAPGICKSRNSGKAPTCGGRDLCFPKKRGGRKK